jgi:Zn-dependent M28 family amino/carboxypeptidase
MLSTAEKHVLATSVSAKQIEKDIRRYSALHSRHVAHVDNTTAVDMLVADLKRIGKGQFEVTTPEFPYDGLLLSNVEAVFKHTGNRGIVLVSAHLDSTASNPPPYFPETDPAPGADDDASGIAGVLAAARAIVRLAALDTEIPRREIRFVLFNAEEVKRIGSREYAREACDREERGLQDEIVGVFQIDMIGYNSDTTPAFQLDASFSEDSAVQAGSLKLAVSIVGLCGELALELKPQIYVFHPDMSIATPRNDPSDHRSFHEVGYPACLVTEDGDPGPAPDDPPQDQNPFYHMRDDTIDVLNLDYATAITRAVAAAAWHLATR